MAMHARPHHAVFFAGIAIACMCMANPRWDALTSLLFGGVYEILVHFYNLGHVRYVRPHSQKQM